MKNNSYGMGPMNPLTIAGFNMMQGVPMGKALSDAAMLAREQQMADAHVAEVERRNQEAARAQILQQQLPAVLQQLNPKNMQDAIAKLIAMGAEPNVAIQIAKGIQPDIQDKFNPVTGELVRFNNGMAAGPGQVQNGARGMQPMPGQANMNVNNPYAGTPKGQMMEFENNLSEQKEIGKESRKKLDEIKSKGLDASERIGIYDVLNDLLTDQYQGIGAEGLHKVGGFFGNKGSENALSADGILKKDFEIARAKMLGANPSNMDMKILRAANPSLDKPAATNRNILNAYRAVDERNARYAEAAQEWVNKGGKLEDFETRWQKYIKAYPVLKKSDNRELEINQDNLDNWKQIIFDNDFETLIDANTPITKTGPLTKKENVTPKADPYQALSDEELESRIRALGGK